MIKKSKNTIIKNEIGRFFLGHNLMEYKSADDITLTLIRKRKPVKLFSYLQTHGVSLETTGEGIYVVRGYCPFPIQFIILRELNEDAHVWLISLTNDMEKDQFQKFLMAVQQLQKKSEKIYADAVVSVVTQANHKQFENMKEDESMYGELLRILKPDLDEEIEAAVRENTQSVTKSVTQDVTNNMILRMLEKGKYDYDEIAEIAGTSVETVKKMAKSAVVVPK